MEAYGVINEKRTNLSGRDGTNMVLKEHKKPATNLPSAEQTPMGNTSQKMARKGQATFDRYTYIAKANYEGSHKEV